MSETVAFWKQMLRNPKEVMALAPSSTALCRKMAAQCRGGQGNVVELGAGTGKITQALLEAGIPPERLFLIELNAEFVEMLRAKFPDVTVHHAGAQEVADLGIDNVDFVVSGLPLLGMSEPLQNAIVEGVSRVLSPGGRFVQFTYGPLPPIRKALRDRLAVTAQRMGGVLLNLPPASVYSFSFGAHAS